MWFPNDVWLEICSFLFPVWGRNPWLKKYNLAIRDIPRFCVVYSRPQKIIRHYPHFIFTIDFTYLPWKARTPFIWYFPRNRLIKNYTFTNV